MAAFARGRAICGVLRCPLRCDGARATRRQATSFYLARWRTARSRSIARAHPGAISRLAPRLDRGIFARLDRDGLRSRTLLHGTTRPARQPDRPVDRRPLTPPQNHQTADQNSSLMSAVRRLSKITESAD